ncbi:MAG: response regulator [Desulfobacteraceae bacterium]|jgi:two-component system response regulator
MSPNNPQKELSVILVAEDDPDDRFLIEQAFRTGGFSNRLFFVEDGVELLDYLFGREQYAANGSTRPGCLLLDLKMPRMDGREALQAIRQNPEYADMPILILSTSDSENDKQYCTELGVYDYVTKPDNFAGLLALADKAKTVCCPG